MIIILVPIPSWLMNFGSRIKIGVIVTKISSNKVRDTLLAKGYFPKELPPVFTTADFGRNSQQILLDWQQSGLFGYKPIKKRANSYEINCPHSECEIVSTPKHGYERRPISIVHPLSQAILCNEIGEGWKDISKWLQHQHFSSDLIKVSDFHLRGVKPLEFKFHQAKIAFIEGTADWLAKADISRFYHSIYTHSLTWAAYGKEKYKSQPKDFKGSLADRLDVLVRGCNRNQTIGIPVGPESSRILADIISSAIDEAVFSKTKIDANAIDRLQDDWFVGTSSLEEADEFISLLTSVYRTYELDLNGEKTSVDRSRSHLSEEWVQEIMAFLSHRPDGLFGQRLRAFLTLILRLQKQNPKAPVVGYAISVIENDRFAITDVETVESFLLKAATMSPRAMDRICTLLINLRHSGKNLATNRIGERLSQLAVRNLANGHQFEAMWQIYALRGLRYSVRERRLIELVEAGSSSVIPLILLDMKSKGYCALSLPTSTWEGRVTPENSLRSPNWLLAYEGIRHGWLRDTKRLTASKLFEPMLRRGIVFYDERRTVVQTQKSVRLKRIWQSIQRQRVKRYMSGLRGFTIGDDYN